MFDEEVGQADSGNSTNSARLASAKRALVPGRLYQLAGEVLSFTAQVDSGLTPQPDERFSDTQQGEVRSRC